MSSSSSYYLKNKPTTHTESDSQVISSSKTDQRDESISSRGRASSSKTTSSSKSTNTNSTYKRALDVFFSGEELSQEQLTQLPQEIEGFSVKRKQLIKRITNTDNQSERLPLLHKLRKEFGLPQDIRVLCYALTLDNEHLTLDALIALETWLKGNTLGVWNEEVTRRLHLLEVRSFNMQIVQTTIKCLQLIH